MSKKAEQAIFVTVSPLWRDVTMQLNALEPLNEQLAEGWKVKQVSPCPLSSDRSELMYATWLVILEHD